MTKILCDICGKEMPSGILTKPIADYRFAIVSHGKAWNICNDCREELSEWIKDRKAEKAEICQSVMRGEKNDKR